MATTDGSEAHRLIRKLKAVPANDALAVLAEYAKSGPIDHVRTHAMSLAAARVDSGDRTFATLFEAGLSDLHVRYWSINGLVRVSGVESFPTLTALAKDSTHRLADRANAIRVMALHSGQHFIRGLPTDPGYWKELELPLQALDLWAVAGFPKGPGFDPPNPHPKLGAPETRLDQIASRLDAKLAKLRRERQDPVNPSNWLVPASEEALAEIEARWQLPPTYLDFLRYFSPLEVTITNRNYYQGLDLYGASKLLTAQHDYSFNPVSNTQIADWPAHYVVIADHALDPYVLDLSRIRGDDAPVLTAVHGEGAWDFDEEAPSFLAFLERLSR